jgi:hypothetical protein
MLQTGPSDFDNLLMWSDQLWQFAEAVQEELNG